MSRTEPSWLTSRPIVSSSAPIVATSLMGVMGGGIAAVGLFLGV